MNDLWTAFGRVLTRNRPTGEGLIAFVGDEIIGNALAWATGLASTALVQAYFVKRAWWNLGGLTAQRTAVSGDELGWISWLASYAVGLLALITVRTVVIGTLRELSALRAERRRRG